MKGLKRFVALLFLPVTGLFFLGEVSAAPLEPMVRPETIILISLDTTRADHMSCYGYAHETTPNIDALAKESLFFEHPFAPAPMTLPSHASMFTGLLPPTHGVHDNLNSTLPNSALTLPEILRQQGFTTYGIVSSMVLRADRGLSQGFDRYDDSVSIGVGDTTQAPNARRITGQRNGKETTARALQWLSDNAEKKKFMFIHYFDAHSDYNPPAPFDTRFKNPYDGEIAFTDYCVGQILEKLKELDLYDNSLIALVGDHGELLGEHNEATHAFFIYQNVLRVPMMFKPPGVIQPRRIEDPSSLVDVTPTLLSLAGLSVPEAMQGVDLSNYFRPDFTLPNRVIYAESMTPTAYNCSGLLGIVMNRWHYIQTERPELYDRIKDPSETNNLVAQYPAQASKMKDHLARLLTEAKRADAVASTQLDAETLEQLATLGYIEGNVVVDYSFEEGKEDPKDMIAISNQMEEVSRMIRTGQEYLAIKHCNEIIQQHPKVAEAYRTLSTIYYNRKEQDKAMTVLLELLALLPDDRPALIKLFGIYEAQKDYTKAIDILNRLIAVKPNDATSYKLLADIYMKQNSFDEALEVLDSMPAVLPRDAEAMLMLGVIYLRRNDVPDALASFLGALALDPKSVSARINAAGMYLKLRNPEQALLLCEQALAQNPSVPEAHGILATIKMDKEYPQLYDPQSALIHAQTALLLSKDTRREGKSENPGIFETLAKAWAANGRLDEAITAATRAKELYQLKGLSVEAGKMERSIESYQKQKEKQQ